jgi:predicted CoA-binding protein
MPSIAIIGASNHRRKFGNKAVRAYQHKGWDVYPVHPHESSIEGLTAYKTIADVPRPIDRVSLYLPAQVTLTIIDDIAAVEPEDVFFNPGADSPEVIAKARVLGMNVIQACVIVEIGLSPAQFP